MNGEQHHREPAPVVVVGGGNAGLVAALAAREHGSPVLLLERATEQEAGGNTYFTAGATRISHDGLEDLREILEPDVRHRSTEVPAYSQRDYAEDIATVTEGRNDPELTAVLVAEAADGVRWLHRQGVRYRLLYERQAYERPDGSFRFWGGLHVGTVDGGVGLIRSLTTAARRAGVEVRYGQHVVDLVVDDDGRVTGVVVEADGQRHPIAASAVVLASGGFESSAELRRRFLGDGWERARVRGTRFNTGELLLTALEHGAAPGGDWASCHSVAWDAWAEDNESNRELTNRLTRQSYPLGIVVNVEGRRFLDEGADFRNYTYAKYGREILRQPGGVAFQVFDATTRPMLRSEEYDMPGVGVVVADDLAALAEEAGIDAAGLRRTVEDFNASIDRSVPMNPTVLDGRSARVDPPKSNWAMPIEHPPFYAFPVTCGITFTFGGLRADVDGRVLRPDGTALPGLHVCGEALGGLFSGNYPGGSGLAAGTVFGRRAGRAASRHAVASR